MAVFITTNTTAGVTVAASNDTWITREGAYVAADLDAFNFATFDNLEYFLQGDLFAGDDGIVSSSGANNNDIVVGPGASINAGGDGIQLFGNSTADSGHNIVNDGSIVGLGGEGVDVRAQSSNLVNNGTITSQGFGVFYSGNANEVTNHGFVSSDSTGIGVSGTSGRITNTGEVSAGGGNGLDLNGDNGRIANAGSVIATSIGIDATGDGAEITNTGLVTGDTGVQMSMSPGTGPSESRFVNAGTVHGSGTGVSMTVVDDIDRMVLVNSGGITVLDPDGYAVAGDSGVDTVRNSGTIEGNIQLSGGNDLYRGDRGHVDGRVSGGNGDDTLIGGSEDNDLDGGNGDDEIRGNSGNDNLRGRSGADAIFGGADDDVLLGESGQDILHGNSGDDDLRGSWGDDTLYGGTGDDLLSGGGGDDIFVFTRNAGNDLMSDFENGDDRMDVSAFGISGFGAISSAIRQNGGDAFIDWSDIGGDGLLIIEGAAGQLNGSDFIF